MPRGGMCKNPFAGNPSMNEIDEEIMQALKNGDITVDQAFAMRIIKMSKRHYLYFGLGANRITPERFLEAYYYLFKVRSDDPKTWGSVGYSERFRDLNGVMCSRRCRMSNSEIRARCFDTHYIASRSPLPMGSFLRDLRQQRGKILNDNRKQVFAYMASYRAQEFKRLRRRKGKHAYSWDSAIPTLINPESSKALAMLYLYGRAERQAHRVPKAKTATPLTKGIIYKHPLI